MKDGYAFELRLIRKSQQQEDNSRVCESVTKKIGFYASDELQYQLQLGAGEFGYTVPELAIEVLRVYLPEFLAIARAQKRSQNHARKVIAEKLNEINDVSLEQSPAEISLVESIGEMTIDKAEESIRRRPRAKRSG